MPDATPDDLPRALRQLVQRLAVSSRLLLRSRSEGDRRLLRVAHDTGFAEAAARRNFTAVFAQGLWRQWQDGRVGRSGPPDDVAFLAALVDRLIASGIALRGNVSVDEAERPLEMCVLPADLSTLDESSAKFEARPLSSPGVKGPLSAHPSRSRSLWKRSANSYVRSQGTRQQPAFRLTAGRYLVIVIGCTGPEIER